MRPEWKDFVGGKWEQEINVRRFHPEKLRSL